MAYFVGHGYSSDFSRNMSRLLTELRPESPILLTTEIDIVCECCPNNECGLCNKPELVAAYDRAVLTRCGLLEGEILGFGWFTSLVQEKILAPGLRSHICGNCQWNDICASQPSRWSLPDRNLWEARKAVLN